MCFVHCSQQINVGCRVVFCEPVPPVASLLYLTSFFVSSNQPRHLGPAQPCHRCHVLPQQTLDRALLFPIFLIANRARHPFIDLMASSRLEPNLLAGLQKCPDLFQAQFFCVLHAYLQSQACEIQSPSGSCCVINTVALQAHPALYKTVWNDVVACNCASNFDRVLEMAAVNGLPAPTHVGDGISVIIVLPDASAITTW